MGFRRQHEPLRVPREWKGDSRNFVSQLERVLDVLFNRKINENDVDPKFLSNIFTQTPVILDKGDDANTALASGLYYIRQEVAHTPVEWAGMIVVNSHHAQGRDIYQLIFNEKGLWVRDLSGAPPTWKEWRRYRGTYVPGQSVTVDPQTLCYGFVTGGTKYINVMVPCLQDVPQSNLTVSSVKMELRGPNGYVDIFTASNIDTEKVGTQGYTFNAYGIAGMARLQIVKSTEFTNVSNNVPITGYIQAMTFSIQY